MKKLLILLVTAVLISSLVACGNAKPKVESEKKKDQTQEVVKKDDQTKIEDKDGEKDKEKVDEKKSENSSSDSQLSSNKESVKNETQSQSVESKPSNEGSSSKPNKPAPSKPEVTKPAPEAEKPAPKPVEPSPTPTPTPEPVPTPEPEPAPPAPNFTESDAQYYVNYAKQSARNHGLEVDDSWTGDYNNKWEMSWDNPISIYEGADGSIKSNIDSAMARYINEGMDGVGVWFEQAYSFVTGEPKPGEYELYIAYY